MNRVYLDYLEDILDAMEKAESMISNVDFETFEKEYLINFAVVRALEIIGEATKRLPHSFRGDYEDIPWRLMAGMRDRLSHKYDDINLELVWETVKERIPEVKPKIKQLISDLE